MSQQEEIIFNEIMMQIIEEENVPLNNWIIILIFLSKTWIMKKINIAYPDSSNFY